MSQYCSSILSNANNQTREALISWFLDILTVLLLVGLIKPGISQSTNQIADHSFQAQQLVSKKQLLTPEKALKATNHAREDLLHGREESARKEIQRALDIDPHCGLALSLQGIVSYQDHDYVEASHAFQRSIEEDPTLGVAYLGLGIVFTKQHRFREALVPLDRAAALLPTSYSLHFQTALAYLGVHESESGLKEIADAEFLARDDEESKSGLAYLRGVAYLQLKKFGAAKEALQQVIESSPDGAYAPPARKVLEQLNSVLDERR